MKPTAKRIFSCEKAFVRDRITGTNVVKLTDYPAEHMNLYITKSSFTPVGKTIVFLSTCNGWANLVCLDVRTRVIRELTNHEDDVQVFSPVIASDGNRVYYSLANAVRAVDMDSGMALSSLAFLISDQGGFI